MRFENLHLIGCSDASTLRSKHCVVTVGKLSENENHVRTFKNKHLKCSFKSFFSL